MPRSRLPAVALALVVAGVGCGGEEAVPVSPPAFELCTMDQDVEEEVVSVHAGAGFTLAVLNTGRLLFWGYNEPPGLAAFTQFEYFSEPVYVPSHVDCVRDLRIAGSSICAIRDGGDVICWGSGVGHKPVALDGFHDVVSFVNGGAALGASLEDGASILVGLIMIEPEPLYLDAPTWPFSAAPMPALWPREGGPGCYVTVHGALYCYGKSSYIGTGDPADLSAEPVPALGIEGRVEEVVSGWNVACARTEARRIYCWGAGAVGNGTAESAIAVLPTELPYPVDVMQMSAGATNLALDANGDLWCWGSTLSGQCGVAHQNKILSPRKVENLPPVKWAAAGFSHTCVLAVDGDVYCFGKGEHGELGNGEWKDSTSPVKVRLPFD